MKRTKIRSFEEIQMMKDMRLAGMSNEEIEVHLEMWKKKAKKIKIFAILSMLAIYGAAACFLYFVFTGRLG